MFKALSQKFATALVVSAVAASAAHAQSVQYSTLFSFTNGGPFSSVASNAFTSGDNTVTLTLAGQPATMVTAPSFIDYGTVTVTSSMGSGVTFDGQQVYMEILQSLPTVGTAQVVGSVSGYIDGTSSQGIINWNQPTRFASIGNATYELERLSFGQTSINAMTTGPQTIRGYVTASTVPEPGSVALVATGLAGVAAGLRRRKQNA